MDDHRSELRELNELTVARLEARIGQSEARLEADMRVGLTALEARIDQRFGDLIKWSFLFWCGAVAAAALARV
ncbi:MAG: hypothetical protein O2973_13930 [Gemmatimonadetes bacterium]|nr:hypothetical protein [Gemmatimonadota bacterium]